MRRPTPRRTGAAMLALALIIPLLPATAVQAGARPAPLASVAAAAASPAVQRAINSGAAAAAGSGVTTYATVLDRSTGRVLGRTGNAGTQVASESLVKMMLATYYLVQHRGHLPAYLDRALRKMIVYSDDPTASSFWTNDAVPLVRNRYGISGISAAQPYAGYWGRTRVTADAIARFLYKADNDPMVGPWLFSAMRATANNGSDGYNQNIGFNRIPGAGSKQGWGNDNWVNGANAVHSVGFSGGYIAAVLQSGGSGTYGLMRGTATYTAAKINSAFGKPTRTRVSATTTMALADRDMTIRAAVTTTGGRPAPNARVRLYAKTERGPWRYSGVHMTDGNGRTTFRINSGLEGQRWKVVVPQGSGYAGSQDSVLVYVRRAITGVENLPATADRNQVLVASGRTGTGYRGQKLRIQHITSHGWVSDGATVVQNNGSWKVYFRAANRPAVSYYRAYIEHTPGSYQPLTWSLVSRVVVR